MERFIIPNLQLFDEFIEVNKLIHTDLRYNLGDKKFVFDVVDYSSEASEEEQYRRMLLIEAGQETMADFFWKSIADLGSNYVLPIKLESPSDKIAVYEIPVSTRPLLAETKSFKNKAQNRMNNERIAASLGRMVRLFADQSGLYLDPNAVESRSVIIDFIDEFTEPVMMAPPIRYGSVDVEISEYYSELFDHDPSFQGPFLDALNDNLG